MTRARQRLWLSRCRQRQMFGESRTHATSPFLSNLLHSNSSRCFQSVNHRHSNQRRPVKSHLPRGSTCQSGFMAASKLTDTTNCPGTDRGELSIPTRFAQNTTDLALAAPSKSRWAQFADGGRRSEWERRFLKDSTTPTPMMSHLPELSGTHGKSFAAAATKVDTNDNQQHNRNNVERRAQVAAFPKRRPRRPKISSLMSNVAAKPFRKPRPLGS